MDTPNTKKYMIALFHGLVQVQQKKDVVEVTKLYGPCLAFSFIEMMLFSTCD
jgi:hypothetical protein